MKYSNQINTLLVLVGVVVAIIAFAQTFWNPNSTPRIEIPPHSQRPSPQDSADTDAAGPALNSQRRGSTPRTAAPTSAHKTPTSRGLAERGAADRTRGSSLPAELRTPRAKTNVIRSKPTRPGPPQSSKGRGRQATAPGGRSVGRRRPPGQTPQIPPQVLPGASARKARRQDRKEASPPPVRSSMPEQRPR